jgi:hypothetical protein
MKYLFYFYLLLFGITFSGCEKGQSTAVLEIYVLDPLGNRVDSAMVNIYRTREDWENEENEIKPSETTPETGLIRFVNLEAGTYYLDVKKDLFNNWEGKIETTVQSIGAFYVNTEFIIVKESRSADVALSKGKKWKPSTLKQLGRTFEIDALDPPFRCRYDNILIFYKSGKYEIQGMGLKCTTIEMPIVESGTWRFNDTGTVLTLTVEGKTPITWNVLESSRTKLLFQESLFNPFFGLTNSDITYFPVE